MATVRQIINSLWPNKDTRPLLVGPDSQPSPTYTPAFIKVAYPYIDASTYHAYASSTRDHNISKHLMDPAYLAR